MSAPTVTLGPTTHEETAGGLTACGKRIGHPNSGWRRNLENLVTSKPIPVNCSACLRVRAAADAFMEKL